MEFTLSIDKKTQARIDAGRCINCGDCAAVCPTGAIQEFQKAVSGIFLQEGSEQQEMACSRGCPMGVIPQAVAALVRDGETEKAWQHIAQRNPMPWLSAQTCEFLCGGSCKLRNIGRKALNMQMIEKDVVSQGTPISYRFTRPAYDRVAVIGGGPAGILAAFELRRRGYRPVIFEKRDRLGGAASWGIGDFRLQKSRLHGEIDHLIETGIEVRYGYVLGENFTLQQVLEEGFAAVLLAIGASERVPLSIPGSEARGVYAADEILREQNDGGYSRQEREHAPAGLAAMGERVIVVGNGRLAAEVSQLLALQEKQVTCILQRQAGEIEVSSQTLDIMIEAGVEVRHADIVRQIITGPEGVKAVEVITDNHATNLFCDAVVYGLGQQSNAERISKVETYPDGCIRVDAGHRTNKPRIYACGDVTGESDSVVEAMAAGRSAALAIDADLRGASDSLSDCALLQAPEGETIYPENIRPDQQTEAFGLPHAAAYTGDIVSLLRSAGISEEMPVYFRDEGPRDQVAYQRVAIIGGGIAGITAAVSLARRGVRPTIFEKTARLGGSCQWLATNRRFDHPAMEKELAKLEESGIEVCRNTTGGVRPDVMELLKEYDAVLFAIGESAGRLPQIPGIQGKGVLDIVSFMRTIAAGQIPPAVGEKVLIVGSDEITVDAARAMKRICPDVTLLTDCGRGKLQIKTGAVRLLLSEGIHIVTGVRVDELLVKRGRVCGLNGTVLENGSSIGFTCDTVLFGESKAPDVTTIALKNLYLDLDENGYIKTNSLLAANMRGVFAIGNFHMSAIDAGRAGAAAVLRYLTGEDQAIVVDRFHPEEMAIEHERIQGARVDLRGRQSPATAACEARRCIDCGYHKAEARRCIGCGICQRYCPVSAIWMEGVKAEAGRTRT